MSQTATFNPTIADSEIRVSPSAAAQLAGIMQNAEQGVAGIRGLWADEPAG